MPVVEHEVHQHGIRDAEHRYGCWDRLSFKNWFRAQDGWWHDGSELVGKSAMVPHRLSTDCRYDRSLSDPACRGCRHAGSGERYVAEQDQGGAK